MRIGILHFSKLINHFSTSSAFNARIIPFNLSDIGEGIRNVKVNEWHVVVGQHVNEFDNICDVSSDKANVTITSRYSGIIKKRYHSIDEFALVGHPLIDIEIDDDQEFENTSKSNISSMEDEPTQGLPKDSHFEKESVIATPVVRRLARENNINLADIIGSGKGGRILNEDILNYTKNKNVAEQNFKVEKNEISGTEMVLLRGNRKAMYNLMTEANKIPHFYAYETIKTDKMLSALSLLKSHAQEKYSVRITMTSLLIKAVSSVLSDHPILNSRLDDNHENIIYNTNHNIGVAMNTPGGLVVPVVRDVKSKNLLQIVECLKELSDRGQNNKLSVSDLSGGTFTISNTAPIKGLMGNSIIIPPQVAILSIGRPEKKLEMSSDGQIVESEYSTMILSGDHRLIDGFTACSFLNQYKSFLENPLLMLLNEN